MSTNRNNVWDNIRLLLVVGHKPVRIAKLYTFRGVTAQQIRWKNYSRWHMDAKSGSKRGPRCPTCRKQRPCFKTEQCRRCYYDTRRKGRPSGPDAPSWRGGVTLTPDKIRLTPRYKRFRKAVLQRDQYRCVECGVSKEDGAKLEVDHIKSQAERPDLIFDFSNVRTLCVQCHMKTDTWGNKARLHRAERRRKRREGIGNIDS